MSYVRFDRHAEMSSETRGQIMDLLGNVRFDGGFELTNMIYGLFDGYLYDEILTIGREQLHDVVFTQLESIVSTIKQYPTKC
jgi:hypothetical protein